MRPATSRHSSIEDGQSRPSLAARGLGRRSPAGAGWLVRDIDLAVHPGERLGLQGPTGSGKSLILRALALLDGTDAGEVLWGGRPIPDLEVPAFRSRVVYLQQRSPLIEGTVEDNLRFAFGMNLRRGTSPSRERLDALVAGTGRDAAFLDSRTDHLSGGERQTVALMRALLVDPVVLLLDEPTAALDRAATATLEDMVTEWLAADRERRAYVWVSHDPSQLDRMAERIVGLRDGRVVGP